MKPLTDVSCGICRLVIFDLDGTLVNAYPAVTHSVNYALVKLGIPKRSYMQVKRAVGWGDRHLMAQFVGEGLADQAIAFYRPHHKEALTAKGGVRFLAGAAGILNFLKAQGFKLAIASNRPTQFTHIILKALGIGEIFDMVLCADKVKNPKPAADIFLEILRSLKITKSQVLYVGDMTIDILSGRNAGIRTVAVATGSSSTKELKDLKPYRVISKINQIKSIIKEW